MRRNLTGAVLGAVVLTVALAGCDSKTELNVDTPAAAPAAREFAEQLRHQVSVDAMMGHLKKLQDIANANGNTRALGTPGYDASVDYVAKTLRDKGFDVQTPEFQVRIPFSEDPQVTVGGQPVTAKPLLYTIGTGAEGVSGPLVPARTGDSPGCEAKDYDGLPVAGAVVLVDRGHCAFSAKETAAVERGAVAVIVANNQDGDQMGGTLGERTDVKIPVVSVTKADGARLRAAPGPTTIKLNAGVRTEHTRNVIAQTKTGSTSDVVMLGAHLDSVPEGPGINDNGSGVAAVLETALQLGVSPDVKNAVRFGFWGAEEEGLLGSRNYVESLDLEALKDVAMYLNFDMLGSPNPGYFTYDGDQSAPPDPSGPPRVPEGSAGIERTLATYLQNAGKTPRDTNFDGRSDYDGFTQAGIPAGGLFSGAEDKMTEEEAKLWKGKVDQPFDPNYHQATDTIDHVDQTALQIHGEGVAYVTGLYAQDQSGRNGIPIRSDRTRREVTPVVKAGWAAALVAVAVVGCSSQSPPQADLSHELAGRITVDAMYTHLRKFAEIAEANGGNRAQGTPGYDASLDYVSKLLKDKGFDVQTPEFDRLGPMQGGDPALVVDGTRYPVVQGSLLVQTQPGGLNAPTLHPVKLAGCTAADYGSKKMTGAIAVVDDTGCSVVVKQDTAVAQGAVGLLVVSTVKPSPTGLFTPGYYRQLKVPVGIIDKTTDTALLGTSAAVKLTLDGKSDLIKSRNLVAQTKTGSTSDVVMAGAHLDSIRGGPGINDNGTGVAALLETALQLGSSPAVHNAVRFAFWGGQETGLDGSTQYVRGLDAGQLADVALYLNFEMLGSTNAGYFTYDGDQSAATTAVKAVPEGSAGIERTLAGYLNLAGVRPADMPLSDTTDYTAFLAAGVPIGGTTTGSSQRKTEVQARLWGGKAGQPFDPNYHTPRDTVDNVDAHTLSIMGPAVAFAVGSYAMSIDGVNGVPSHDKRNRRAR